MMWHGGGTKETLVPEIWLSCEPRLTISDFFWPGGQLLSVSAPARLSILKWYGPPLIFAAPSPTPQVPPVPSPEIAKCAAISIRMLVEAESQVRAERANESAVSPPFGTSWQTVRI